MADRLIERLDLVEIERRYNGAPVWDKPDQPFACQRPNGLTQWSSGDPEVFAEFLLPQGSPRQKLA
ncbi:hypothetical protein U0023_34930 (plasmid) [Microvirga lotononidis]|nr:hypothetical protein [Microvirga lotononidis]WQO32069.1 hypothetical protein U0023_34930 [Microvirga lotononidis]